MTSRTPNISGHSATSAAGSVNSSANSEGQATHLVKVLGESEEISVSGTRYQRMAMIAEAQNGRAARWQLLAAGISGDAIQRLIKNAALHRVHQGVYAVGHTAPLPLARETAAVLACGDRALLSHLSATALWALHAPYDGPVHVTVIGGGGRRHSGIHVHRSKTIVRDDIRMCHNLPVTSPARGLLDIAGLVDERELERAMDEAFVQRIVRVSELRSVLERNPSCRGARAVAALIKRRDGPLLTRSQAEEAFLALIRSSGLPTPEVNARFHGYDVDFLWRSRRLVVEVDGFRFHSTRGAFERDRAKGATLAAAGVSVMRTTWRQIEDAPYVMVARVAQALAWRDAADAGVTDAV